MLTKFLNFSSQHFLNFFNQYTLSVSQSLNSDLIKYNLKKQFILNKNTSLWIDRSTVITGNTQPMTNNRHTNGDRLKALIFLKVTCWMGKWQCKVPITEESSQIWLQLEDYSSLCTDRTTSLIVNVKGYTVIVHQI